MAKELVVSSSSHETKVAILEENQVVEAYFERKKEYSLAGSIYKGRVTRVLPGMQSAFVDVGLERDAFLYVSDFFEDTEEYDKIVSTVEEKILKMDEGVLPEPVSSGATPPPVEEAVVKPPAKPPAQPPVSSRPVVPEPVVPERTVSPSEEPYHPSRRSSRRRRPPRKGFPESKYARQTSPGPPPRPERSSAESTPVSTVPTVPTILPGESLAKYKDWKEPSGMEAVKKAEPAREEPSPATTEPYEAVGSAIETLSPETPGPSGAVEEVEGKAQSQAEAAVEPPTADVSLGHPAPAATPEEPPTSLEVAVGVGSETLSDQESPEQDEELRTALETVRETMEHSAAEAEGREAGGWQAAAPVASPREAELPGSGPLESPAEEGQTSEPAPVEAAVAGESVPPASLVTEPAGEEEKAAEPSESGASRTGEEASPASQQAAVREGSRNPRYTRKSRWQARRDAQTEPPRRSDRPRERVAAAPPQIADLLKGGQEIIVQIAKEPLGKKGARITSHIALPGRYLVYMPTVNHVGVSHKIASEEERLRLKRIIQEHSRNVPGGFIVRTAGEGRSEEEFRQDILFLANLWADIKAQAEKAKAPALLHHDLSLIQRILRDQLSEDFTAVWLDDAAEYERIVSWVSRFQPSIVGRVKLYTKDVPLFEEMGIQEEINKALRPKVWLKSGGYIVINQTEALVAIDVNTGKFVGKSNRLEDTIVKTNVDAIQEIVRQIRLRDLGGIIVIDFIDMDERKNRHRVMAALEEALKADRSPSKMLAFNEFGLVAITRKRVKQSLERTLCQPCFHCGASGYVKSPATVCGEIFTETKRMASQLQGRQITLRVNPEVGKALKARDNTILPEIEEMIGKPVVIRNDPALHVESFAFE